MTDWAKRLDRSLGVPLRRLAERYQKDHPESVCRVWSHSLGEATVYQGYSVGASFQMPGGTVQLVVDLGHLDRNPGFESAYLVWLEPTREVEVECPPSIIQGRAEERGQRRSMARLKKWLPRLMRALRRALRRGHPAVRQVPNHQAHFSAPKRIEIASGAVEPPEGPADSNVRQALLSVVAGRLASERVGFAMDFVRRYQAEQRGWNLPPRILEERLWPDGCRSRPGAHEWREIYAQDPGSQGVVHLSRVVFAGPREAFLCLKRNLGFGDSHYWISSRSWEQGKEDSWQKRWSEPRAMELCELVRLRLTDGHWAVIDSIDLLGPVPRDVQLAAVRRRLEEELSRVSLSGQSSLNSLTLGHTELRCSGDVVHSDVAWLEVDAGLKEGRSLRFFVLPSFSLHSIKPTGPINRLVVVDHLEMSKVAAAVKSWLDLVG